MSARDIKHWMRDRRKENGGGGNTAYLVKRLSAVSVPHAVPFKIPRPARAVRPGSYCQPLEVASSPFCT